MKAVKKSKRKLTSRQTEELAKLLVDLGKLVFASLVLGLFQVELEPKLMIGAAFLGLTISLGLFILGLKLFKEVKETK